MPENPKSAIMPENPKSAIMPEKPKSGTMPVTPRQFILALDALLPVTYSDLVPQSPTEAFCEGVFLTIAQMVRYLRAQEIQSGDTANMLAKYREALRYCQEMLRVYLPLPNQAFPLAQLRHVTVARCFSLIVDDAKIPGSFRQFHLDGVSTPLRVSCWEAHIPPAELEKFREKRFAHFLEQARDNGVAICLSDQERAEVKGLMANSPAMSEDSRDGNFQFSFSTKDLLAMYQNQHCGGKKPVLRVLGTEARKRELVHWILVHSPDQRHFDHLPTVQPPAPLSVDGPLKWTPESMSDHFTWMINNGALEKNFWYWDGKPRRDPWIWSNLVFAFYLPGKSALRIDRRSLLENTHACATAGFPSGADADGFLAHEPELYVCKARAQAIIDAAKEAEGMPLAERTARGCRHFT